MQARYRQGPVAAELSTQIRREQHSARELDLLRPLGWTVLHDRLAPGTEHRLAHVLAGPGGLVVATVLLVAEPLRRYGQQLYTGQVPLQQWFTTRWWEVQALQAAVTARLAHWPWQALAYPIALMPDDAGPPAGQVPPGMLRYPRGQDGVPIRGSGTVRAFVQAVPASLGRLAAAELGAAVQAACPPAGVQGQRAGRRLTHSPQAGGTGTTSCGPRPTRSEQHCPVRPRVTGVQRCLQPLRVLAAGQGGPDGRDRTGHPTPVRAAGVPPPGGAVPAGGAARFSAWLPARR